MTNASVLSDTDISRLIQCVETLIVLLSNNKILAQPTDRTVKIEYQLITLFFLYREAFGSSEYYWDVISHVCTVQGRGALSVLKERWSFV